MTTLSLHGLSIRQYNLLEERREMELQMMFRKCKFCGCWFKDEHMQTEVYVCDKCVNN